MKTKILAIAMAALLALTGLAALAEEGTITVQGIGVVNVDADRATISLGVREIAPDVKTAQSTVNEKLDAVISALEAMGVGEEDISTSGIGIYPNYDYSGEEKIVGYTAYNSINVSVSDGQNAGAYIDAAFAAGANNLDYVDFYASDTAEAGEKALALAVESAEAKARVLARAAGVALGRILQIDENSDGYYNATTAFARVEEADAGSGTRVMGSSQQVTATVSVTYEIAGQD